MSDLTRQSLETIEQLQNEKLRAMLDLCARGHPYYASDGANRTSMCATSARSPTSSGSR